MSIKELKELLKVLRANGVVSYETPQVKLSLLETLPSKEATPTSVSSLKDDYEEPSEEDLLFYSSLAPKTDQA